MVGDDLGPGPWIRHPPERHESPVPRPQLTVNPDQHTTSAIRESLRPLPGWVPIEVLQYQSLQFPNIPKPASKDSLQSPEFKSERLEANLTDTIAQEMLSSDTVMGRSKTHPSTSTTYNSGARREPPSRGDHPVNLLRRMFDESAHFAHAYGSREARIMFDRSPFIGLGHNEQTQNTVRGTQPTREIHTLPGIHSFVPTYIPHDQGRYDASRARMLTLQGEATEQASQSQMDEERHTNANSAMREMMLARQRFLLQPPQSSSHPLLQDQANFTHPRLLAKLFEERETRQEAVNNDPGTMRAEEMLSHGFLQAQFNRQRAVAPNIVTSHPQNISDFGERQTPAIMMRAQRAQHIMRMQEQERLTEQSRQQNGMVQQEQYRLFNQSRQHAMLQQEQNNVQAFEEARPTSILYPEHPTNIDDPRFAATDSRQHFTIPAILLGTNSNANYHAPSREPSYLVGTSAMLPSQAPQHVNPAPMRAGNNWPAIPFQPGLTPHITVRRGPEATLTFSSLPPGEVPGNSHEIRPQSHMTHPGWNEHLRRRVRGQYKFPLIF